MSLESKIDELKLTIDRLILALGTNGVAQVQAQPRATMVVPAPVAPAAAPPAPVAPAMPEFTAPAAPAPQAAMPPLPSFAAPVAPAAPAPQAVPFSDGKGLIDFVMTKYKELEAKAAGSGAGIQSVLTGLGYQNINEVKPEHYPAFYNGVMAL